MKISIDCRHIDSSGIGVYLKGCLPYFLDSPNDFILLGDKEKIIPFTMGKSNYHILQCDIKPFSIHETFFFSKFLLKKINMCDLFYSPYFNLPCGVKIPIFLTIHDIIFPDMPELISAPGLWMRMYFYRRAFNLTTAIFTVSEFSKSRIEYHLGTKKPVINASNAVNNSNYVSVSGKKPKKKNIIFIGNIKKHKGLSVLLDAFLKCREAGLEYRLIIVGNKDNFRSGDREISARLDKLGNQGVEFTGFIPDKEKILLLSESALLVQPSLYEGWGYPPLEAMFAGTPALISNIPVFREVYENFPVTFFKEGDSGDLQVKIMELLSKKEPLPLVLPLHLREKYSFKNTTDKILAEFEKIVH